MVEKGYALRPLEDRDRKAFQRGKDPNQTDRIVMASDFVFLYGLHGIAGALSAMLLAFLSGLIDRTFVNPVLMTSLPMLGVLGLYVGHRRWRKRRRPAEEKRNAFRLALEKNEVAARIYETAELLFEHLPHTYEWNVLAKTEEGLCLWLPVGSFEHQGKGVNRVCTKLELLKGQDGSLLAAWPVDKPLTSAVERPGLAEALQRGGITEAGEVELDFEAYKPKD